MEEEMLGLEYELWLDEVEATFQEPIIEEELWRELNFYNRSMIVSAD